MRTEVFHEELDVELSESERDLRGRQAARLALAIKTHKAKAEEEDKAWKERKAELKSGEEKLVEALYTVGKAVEAGVEPRQVACVEVLRGVMVETIRQDTGETVDSRAASKAELGEHQKTVVPGGGAATKKKSKSEDDGVVPDDYRPTH